MKTKNRSINNFFLRTNKRQGWAWLYFRVRQKGVRATMRTRIRVAIEEWNDAIASVGRWRTYTRDVMVTQADGRMMAVKSNGGRVAEAMNRLSESVDRLARAGRLSRSTLEKAVYDAGDDRGTPSELRHICSFYDHLVDGMQQGLVRHHHGRRYSERSIGLWKDFGRVMRSHVDPSLTFADIDRVFIDGFRLALERRGLMETTIDTSVACFRKLCKAAAEHGIDVPPVALTGWQGHRARQDEKRAEIYLTEDELEQLYRMPLTGPLAQARDLFMLGYLSCQRWSDYSRLTADNFITNDEGIDVIALRQKKTGVYVEVPITDDRVYEICRRYDYDFPKMSRKRLNARLHLVLARLSCHVESLRQKVPTVLTWQERRCEQTYVQLKQKADSGAQLTAAEQKRLYRLDRDARRRGGMPLWERNEHGQVVRPKHELVTTHTSRRSGITNMYRQGVLDKRQMMALSGHQTERVLEEYIKVGTSEQARRIYERLSKPRHLT